MGILTSIVGLLKRKRCRVSLSNQIERCKAAMLRRQAHMDELWRSVSYPGQDEHIAALGGCNGEYCRLSEKQERAGAWLRVLLTKRGKPEDLSMAEAIRISAWP